MPPDSDAAHQTPETKALSHILSLPSAMFGLQNQTFGYEMCIEKDDKNTFEVRKQLVQQMVQLRLNNEKPISETYHRQDYNNPKVIDFLFNIFFENGSYVEQIQKHSFLTPLFHSGKLLSNLNWYELLDEVIPLMGDHFASKSNPDELPTTPDTWQPSSAGFLAGTLPFCPVTFAAENTLELPVLPQNSSGSLMGFGVDTHGRGRPLSAIPKAKFDEWQQMHMEHFCKKRKPSADVVVVAKGDDKSEQGSEEAAVKEVPFDYRKKGNHMYNYFLAQLEEHHRSAKNSWNSVNISKYFEKTMKKVEKKLRNVTHRWAMNPMTDVEEYYLAIASYAKNMKVSSRLSMELATECSRQRIWDLSMEAGEKSLMLSRAYTFAISTMTPTLARDINAVMSYQDDPELFERLEIYFGQRYAVEMLRCE